MRWDRVSSSRLQPSSPGFLFGQGTLGANQQGISVYQAQDVNDCISFENIFGGVKCRVCLPASSRGYYCMTQIMFVTSNGPKTLRGDPACLLLVFFGTDRGIVMYSGEGAFRSVQLMGYVSG